MYESQTFDTIINRMLANVSDDIDKREGSVVYTALAPIAIELETYYEALDEVLAETFADTASYYYLAKRAAERNIYPNEATSSTLRMVVEPMTAEVTVGDRFTSEDYELSFVVIGGDDEVGAYDIACETAGSVGNITSGILIPVDEINGLETAIIQGAVLKNENSEKILDDNGNEIYQSPIITTGTDEEDVESFRARYFASLKTKAFGGNREDYISKVKENKNVGACKVIRAKYNDLTPNDKVDDFILDNPNWKNDIQTAFSNSDNSTEFVNWIEKIYNTKELSTKNIVKIYVLDSNYNKASDELIKELKQTLDPTDGNGDGTVPIGHYVEINSAPESEIEISLSLRFKDGYTVVDIKDNVKKTIDDVISEKLKIWEDSDNIEINAIEFLTAVYSNINGYISNITKCEIKRSNATASADTILLADNSVPKIKLLTINDEVI